MLHIHNGDSSANMAKQSSLAGEHFAWRESLITGPTLSGLSDLEWRRIRAKHLSEGYGIDADECERSLLHQDEKLASFLQHEEVVLWFEHDLFCQVQLVYLLNWFSQRDLGKTKLSLICIGEFPGKENFRGLGELNADQLASLFPARNQVTGDQLTLARTAWKAYCSANPRDVEEVLQTDTSFLPFLKATLNAHLRRFPSIRNGLGSIENRALELITEGRNDFTDLFTSFGDAEPVYGLGDAQFWLVLRRMSSGKRPLLEVANGNAGEDGGARRSVLPTELVSNVRLKLTEAGESVLNENVDFVELNGIDIWLGGVHLRDPINLWRWNDQSQTIVSG